MLHARTSTNDNVFARQLYRDEPECLPYIPAARYLIEKYVSAYWKHDSTDLDYVHMELTLCSRIMMDAFPRHLQLKWLARILEVSPLCLYNDPNLPF
ncbi:hypothetical protein A3860_33720 [Niastella vici]|uniref:Uncharacterized protein n=1 Tax=Niastella vici TaxID=1703345 RepID=A0A1V9FPT6_9BACT|nr:hypothetical protein [Niastella vici]OQP60340.1 hypothetical protein A3860_33720 [Niastella vici]